MGYFVRVVWWCFGSSVFLGFIGFFLTAILCLVLDVPEDTSESIIYTTAVTFALIAVLLIINIARKGVITESCV